MPLLDAIRCLTSQEEDCRKTAVTVWKNLPAVTDTFLQLATTPTSPISEAHMGHLERFVILMYGRTSNKTNINEARKQLFPQKGRAFDAIYPTKKGGLFTAHKQGCLSSWSLLGPSAFTKPSSTFTRGMGMDFQRGRIAAFVDDASRSDQVMQRATSLWVQAWV